MPESSVPAKQTWNGLREHVDARLESYLDALPDCPERLREAMGYSLLAGGKRIRSAFVLLACEACGGTSAAAMPAACAIELIHTYSLIHDDLPAMDDDEFRRGKPTNHIVYGEATAILAGDGLLTLAFEVLARDIQPADIAARCCADLASAAGASGMVGGQILDLAAEGQSHATLADLERIHNMKTGRLLAVAPVLGARIARADEQILNNIQRFGNCVGLAFQIADDLLDVSGDPSVVGKGVGKDAAQGKLTYPAVLGIEQSRRRARELVQEALAALVCLGDQGRRLESLAKFVLERDH